MLFPGNNEHPGHHAGAYDRSTERWRRVLPVVVILLLIALVAWPFLEPYALQVEAVTLRSADFPEAIGQLRVVYVSDIHAGKFFSAARVDDLVTRINALSADIVLLGGDYAQDSAGAVAFFRSMPRIHARYGVYAVPGNHDRTTPESNLNQLRAAMQAANVTPLINTVVPVRVGAGTIWLAGVDDINCGHPELSSVAAQVHRDDYVIFLCHSPAIIPDALDARDADWNVGWFDLGLFGHTHGGQVALFGGLVRDERVPEQYVSGLTRVNRSDLLTSRGVGMSVLPIRLLCPPQIHQITITTLD